MSTERQADQSPALPEPAGFGDRGSPAPAEPIHLSEQDIALYRARLSEWRDHQGKHVLIYRGEVHGFYPTRNEALAEGFKRFGRVPYLVKKVDLDEKPRPVVQVVL
jgi:hypothetical protein